MSEPMMKWVPPPPPRPQETRFPHVTVGETQAEEGREKVRSVETPRKVVGD